MKVIEIIIQYLAPALAGGGLMWVIQFRLRIRREGNKLLEDDFNAVAAIVEKSTEQISRLHDKISEIEQQKSDIEAEIRKLRRDNETLNNTLKRYLKNQNPNLI